MANGCAEGFASNRSPCIVSRARVFLCTESHWNCIEQGTVTWSRPAAEGGLGENRQCEV